jgi:hypothetical protein
MLAEIAADLTVRGCPRIACESLDATDLSAHEAMLGRAESFLGAIDIALLAYGTLPDQKRCESSVELTVRELQRAKSRNERKREQANGRGMGARTRSSLMPARHFQPVKTPEPIKPMIGADSGDYNFERDYILTSSSLLIKCSN